MDNSSIFVIDNPTNDCQPSATVASAVKDLAEIVKTYLPRENKIIFDSQIGN